MPGPGTTNPASASQPSDEATSTYPVHTNGPYPRGAPSRLLEVVFMLFVEMGVVLRGMDTSLRRPPLDISFRATVSSLSCGLPSCRLCSCVYDCDLAVVVTCSQIMRSSSKERLNPPARPVLLTDHGWCSRLCPHVPPDRLTQSVFPPGSRWAFTRKIPGQRGPQTSYAARLTFQSSFV